MLMIFPPVPQLLTLKMETDGSHPGLHTGNIQRSYVKTTNPDCIQDHSMKSLWLGLSIKKRLPTKKITWQNSSEDFRAPTFGLAPSSPDSGCCFRDPTAGPLHPHQTGCCGFCLGWRCHRAQRRVSMGLKNLLGSALCRVFLLGPANWHSLRVKRRE